MTDNSLRSALELIDKHGCHTYTSGRCWENGRARGAEFSAEAWCDPCVARDALNHGPYYGEWRDRPAGYDQWRQRGIDPWQHVDDNEPLMAAVRDHAAVTQERDEWVATADRLTEERDAAHDRAGLLQDEITRLWEFVRAYDANQTAPRGTIRAYDTARRIDAARAALGDTP